VNNKEANHNYLYFDITKQERDSAIRYLLGTIIKSRQEGNFPSNGASFDEDVNVYMAHLLFAVSLPEYHEMAEPYLSPNTSEVLRWVRATEDRTIRYFIFKVNADHILIHTAVFDDLAQKDRRKFFNRSGRHFHEVAKLYYDQAAAYHKRIYRKKTGVGDVLTKLAQNFDQYQEVLRRVRRDYFSFVNSFRDQAFKHFMCEFKNFENEFHSKTKMDQFLELYGKWIQSRNPAIMSRIARLAEELQALDPEFKFDVQKNLYGWGGQDDERKCA